MNQTLTSRHASSMRLRHLPHAILLCVTACGDATAPRDPRATVVVRSETVDVIRSVGDGVSWMRFTLPIVIHNDGEHPLRFEYCASAVEQPAADGWRAVWTPICSLPAGPPGEIQPGESRELDLTVIAAVQRPGAPLWESAEIAGTYRFAAGLIPTNLRRGLIPHVGSNAFVLIER